ncbi:MAG TPA: efflux transporter outer membrane subunit [Sedimentisphaerales bacterium]|nr:efflux transporter outer membrane subunit [Sedimentisphaerales bacterium]
MDVVWEMWLCVALGVVTLAGCRMGPDYVRPDTPVPEVWSSDLTRGLTSETMDPNVLASWWTTLGDPVLSRLIELAVEGNLDIATARSRVRQARAQRQIVQGGLLPGFNAGVSATSSRVDRRNGFDTSGQVYSASLDAGWELDLFGGVRRSVEAATANLESVEAGLSDVLVSLLAETALNYVDVRTYQSRLASAEASLKVQEDTYQLVLWRLEAGLGDELAAQQARYNLENTRSQIPGLRTGLQQAKNRLAVLLGRTPGALNAELETPAPVPVPSREIAVGVPAEVVRRRPDVRQAERELAAQTARVGAAVCDLYPQLRLNGSVGIETLSLREPAASRTWTASGGPRLSWAIFDPTVRPNIEVQSALQEQALIQYRAVILSSLEEVENAMIAYVQEQQRRENLRAAADAAQAAAELAQFEYQAGLRDFSDVLDAERSLLSFQDQLRQSEGVVVANVIRLYKALGGGWTSMAEAATTGEVARQF